MLLAGPTLSLRPPGPEDVPALFALGQDPEVTRWFSWGPYTSQEQPAAYVADQAAKRERGEMLDLAMLHREHGLIGITGLAEWSARDRRAIVGTWFARRFWGSGLNLESKRLLFALAFGHCGLERVGAYADVRHERSQGALEKVGFTHEGTLRGWHRHGAVQKDVRIYGLLKAEWEAMEPLAYELTGEVPEPFRLA